MRTSSHKLQPLLIRAAECLGRVLDDCCPLWKKDSDAFWNFFKANYSYYGVLTKKDASKPHGPDNTVWLPPIEYFKLHNRGKYLEYKGERRSMTQWAKHLRITRQTIKYRLEKGLPIEQVLKHENKTH